MFLLYKIYGPHTKKLVAYAAIVTALHEIVDLKHRSPHFRLYPLNNIQMGDAILVVSRGANCRSSPPPFAAVDTFSLKTSVVFYHFIVLI